MAEADNSRKLVIIGDGNVGKTCLLEVFEKGEFVEGPYRPTIFHNSEKEIEHPINPEEKVKFQLWDTAGQEDYKEARTMCYSGTDVLLIGFSIGEPDSLANVEDLWLGESKLESLRDAKAPVTEASAREMMKKIGAREYFETSAKENKGVKELFEEAARLAWGGSSSDPEPGPGCFDNCALL